LSGILVESRRRRQRRQQVSGEVLALRPFQNRNNVGSTASAYKVAAAISADGRVFLLLSALTRLSRL
jgi:hypothetical protein